MTTPDLQDLLSRACDSVRSEVGIGRVADYIPALACVDPNRFGAALVTVDGVTASYGDAAEAFSIQSISKVFSLALALNQLGAAVWDRVGREPSGSPFNSIVQLESERGRPRNPFINAGALVICDLLLEHYAGTANPGESAVQETKRALLSLVRSLADHTGVGMDAEVAASEIATSDRNASLAHFIRAFGNLHGAVAEVLDVYCHQCAIAMSCEQLARAGLFLANHGRDPLTGTVVVGTERARRINALMMLCGHYDASGEFAFRAGIPGKSGVGGGILAIVPNKAAIAVWSPCLNQHGNSRAGTAAMTAIADATGWQAL
ncbi:MAG: glutaminase [Pseudomonadales bacterium]